jgi:hypothetical protein
MPVYLHNPAHNGDIFVSSEIVKILVRSNPSVQFKIVPSCSSALFDEVLTCNVELLPHPMLWLIDKDRSMDLSDKPDIHHISTLHHTLLSFFNGNLYMNMWMFMIFQELNCMDIREKHITMKNLLQQIKNDYNIDLQFNCDDDRELIPSIPQYDIDFMVPFINKDKYRKTIMFFNLNGYSGQDDCRYSPRFNENYIKHLLNDNPDSRIIIVDECNIKHPNLITLTGDVKIKKMLSGSNLILYANICRLCDEVYFKLNGGSFFFLNKDNIRDKSTKYYFLYDNDGEYTNSIINVFNNDIILQGGFRKYNNN